MPYAELGDPQTLNLYAYGRNNPVPVVDADGHTPLDWIWKETGHLIQQIGFGFHLWAGSGASGSSGQCTTAGCTITVRSTPIPVGVLSVAAVGHHALPRGIFDKFVGEDTDAYRFWDGWTTGELTELGQAVNRFNVAHRLYNKAVRDLVERFLEDKEASFGNLTAEQRAQLQRAILDSDEPAIKNFLSRLESASPGAMDTLEGLINQLDSLMPAVLTNGQVQLMNERQCGLPNCQS